VLPLVGPVLLSSLTEVEERSLALEVRGFGRPGRRTLLWWPPDGPLERLVRWLQVAALAGLVAARALGAWPSIA
jgi:energy-coupling factor transport system permease protein